MKKIVYLIIIFALLLNLGLAEAAQIKLTPTPQTKQAGSSATYNIMINTESVSLKSVSFNINYPSGLTVVPAVSLPASWFGFGTNDESNKKIKVAAVQSGGQPLNSDLYSFGTFNVSSAAAGTYKLTISDVSLKDINGNKLTDADIQLDNATLIITAASGRTATCDSTNLNLCTEANCEVYGYWYNSQCNSQPQVIASATLKAVPKITYEGIDKYVMLDAKKSTGAIETYQWYLDDHTTEPWGRMAIEDGAPICTDGYSPCTLDDLDKPTTANVEGKINPDSPGNPCICKEDKDYPYIYPKSLKEGPLIFYKYTTVEACRDFRGTDNTCEIQLKVIDSSGKEKIKTEKLILAEVKEEKKEENKTETADTCAGKFSGSHTCEEDELDVLGENCCCKVGYEKIINPATGKARCASGMCKDIFLNSHECKAGEYDWIGDTSCCCDSGFEIKEASASSQASGKQSYECVSSAPVVIPSSTPPPAEPEEYTAPSEPSTRAQQTPAYPTITTQKQVPYGLIAIVIGVVAAIIAFFFYFKKKQEEEGFTPPSEEYTPPAQGY